jgi:hypothetical protein
MCDGMYVRDWAESYMQKPSPPRKNEPSDNDRYQQERKKLDKILNESQKEK